ncbi:MAG: BACON domain-containing protein [Bacteroidales bacterium]|nr:BACON domain-containing protein [Bacteroidales bacterium]
MKKIFYLAIALTAALAVFSCQQEKDADGSRYLPGPALEIISKDVVFAPQGGSGSIVVNTQQTLTATSDRPWAVLTVAGNRVTVTVDRNENLDSRYSTIKLSTGDATAEITAQQFGLNSAYAWEDSYVFPYGGGELELPYGESGTVWVDVSDADWITAVVDEENHLIHFTVAKSIYNYERTATVTVTIGETYTRELTFTQEKNPAGLNPGEEEPMTFTIEPAWKPYYVVPQSNDQDYSTVGVEVEEDSHAGRYFIKVVPASEINTTDPDELQLYLNRHAPEWAAASPQIHRASAEEEIEALPMGNYVVGAIGVNNDNQINGSVAFAVFSVTKVLSPYEKFLGTWSFDRNGTEDIWTVTEKVANKTYNLTGIDGNTVITAEAEFNATDGTVTLKAQANLGENTVSTSSGNVTGQAAVYGRILYNGTEYYVTGSYPIFTVSFNADASVGTLTPGAVNTNLGEFDLVGFGLYTIVGESAYSATNKASLPATIKHLTQGSGSGDDPGDDPGDDAYGKWLGTWNAGSGRTLTISPSEQGKSYLVTDSGFGGFEYETWLDASTGEMLFRMQLVDEYDIDEYYFIGVDGNNLRYGDEENDLLLARGAINGSTATISPVKYMYNGSEVQATAVTILDYQTEDGNGYDQGWYGLNSITDLALPATLTKASTSSLNVLQKNCYDLDQNRLFHTTRSVGRTKSLKIQ